MGGRVNWVVAVGIEVVTGLGSALAGNVVQSPLVMRISSMAISPR